MGCDPGPFRRRDYPRYGEQYHYRSDDLYRQSRRNTGIQPDCLIASPSQQEVRLQVELKSEFPKDLSGKARFNLEFIPLAYRDRSFQSDTDGDGTYDEYGIFPHHPGAELAETKRPDLPDQSWYVQEWNEERGDRTASSDRQGCL